MRLGTGDYNEGVKRAWVNETNELGIRINGRRAPAGDVITMLVKSEGSVNCKIKGNQSSLNQSVHLGEVH